MWPRNGAFDIWKTQRWPWRVSYPLFIRNAVHWLARPAGIQRALSHGTGETLRVEYDEAVKEVEVVTPGGKTHRPTQSGTRSVYFSQTYETGVYHVRARGQDEKRFAYNLLSSQESSNASEESISIGEKVLGAQRKAAKSNLELWPYIAAAALLFLMVEWYVYNRRILG